MTKSAANTQNVSLSSTVDQEVTITENAFCKKLISRLQLDNLVHILIRHLVGIIMTHSIQQFLEYHQEVIIQTCVHILRLPEKFRPKLIHAQVTLKPIAPDNNVAGDL